MRVTKTQLRKIIRESLTPEEKEYYKETIIDGTNLSFNDLVSSLEKYKIDKNIPIKFKSEGYHKGVGSLYYIDTEDEDGTPPYFLLDN